MMKPPVCSICQSAHWKYQPHVWGDEPKPRAKTPPAANPKPPEAAQPAAPERFDRRSYQRALMRERRLSKMTDARLTEEIRALHERLGRLEAEQQRRKSAP